MKIKKLSQILLTFCIPLLISSCASLQECYIGSTFNKRKLYHLTRPQEFSNYKQFQEVLGKLSEITYKQEFQDEDYWQTPKETERLKTGDCEDLSIYVSELLSQRGIINKKVLGRKNNFRETYHSWVEFKQGKKWYILETTTGEIFNERHPFEYIESEKDLTKDQREDYEKRLALEKN